MSASAQSGVMDVTGSTEKKGAKRPRRSIGYILHPRLDLPSKCKPIHVRCREFCAVAQWVFTFLSLGLTCLFLFVGLLLALIMLGVAITTMDLPPIRTKLSQGTPFERIVTLICDIRVQFTIFFFLMYNYIAYWLRDRGAEDRGSHPKPALRHLRIWRYLADYFPIHLVISEELHAYAKSQCQDEQPREIDPTINQLPVLLPSNVNYLVGYHPHGVFSTGAFVNFATEATGFSKAFPNLQPWIGILSAHFKIPFYRDYIMCFGVVSASKKSLTYLLDSSRCGKTGNFVVVVLGGAPEALDARPGRYIIHTSYRYGFFKLALQTGAHLVPCVSFGEQRMYKQLDNEPGGRLRRFQDWVTEKSTFSPPIFYARGPIPYRTPVDTVVGAPIPCERVVNPTREQIAAIKKVYMEHLQQLFRRYKTEYDPQAADIEFV